MTRKTALCAFLSLATIAVAAPARAHISLERGGTHLSRYGEKEQKVGPCGKTDGKRGEHVYTYAPGQTIDVSLVEFIGHPGYFRIAFDNDGDDGFIPPASINPVDPKRKCPSGPGDNCGKSDFYNSPAVLPGMDNLNPHLTAPNGKYKWSVKLPDVECTNCTLQILQVMEDDAFHGPYDPTPGVGIPDVYYQCIDLVLKRGVVADGGAGPAPDGGGGAGPVESDGGVGPAERDGGVSPVESGSGTPGLGNSNGTGSTGTNSGNGAAPASAKDASSSDSGGCTVTRATTGGAFAWIAMSLGLAFAAARRTRRASR
jgi:hypothetical protein